jgi:hypothetical protein
MPEPTATPLEQTTEAAIACLGAWLYPSDRLVRETAWMACANIGVDYFDAVARVTETADLVHYQPVNADNARYEVAMAALKAVADMRFSNEVRHGIAANGLPIDEETDHHA